MSNKIRSFEYNSQLYNKLISGIIQLNLLNKIIVKFGKLKMVEIKGLCRLIYIQIKEEWLRKISSFIKSQFYSKIVDDVRSNYYDIV